MRLALCAALLALAQRTAVAQAVIEPTFEVTPLRDSATVGDSVALHLRLRLDDRDALLDSVPSVLGEVPRGMRVLATGRLARQRDRTFTGTMVVAFYRTGRQLVPPLSVPFRRNATVISAVVRSLPAPVEIRPVLAGGTSPRLDDIKDLEPTSNADLVWLGMLIVALCGGLLVAAGRRWRRPSHGSEPPVAAATPPHRALDVALQRLGRIEAEQWPARGEVTRHYEAVVDVLRDYLAESARLPARESTSTELVAVLPAALAPNGVRERFRGLLREADLVKFARMRPVPADAGGFLRGVRQLLEGWGTDAVR